MDLKSNTFIIHIMMNKRQAKSLTNKVVLRLRQARGEISQYKLAKGTGMSESSISKIECLKQNPSFMTLAIIADYLGCYFPEVVAQCYPPKEDGKAMEMQSHHSSYFDKAVAGLESLSEEKQKMVYNVICALLDETKTK